MQVLELESLFLKPDCFRDDLAQLLRAVQAQEKQKLHLVRVLICRGVIRIAPGKKCYQLVFLVLHAHVGCYL